MMINNFNRSQLTNIVSDQIRITNLQLDLKIRTALKIESSKKPVLIISA